MDKRVFHCEIYTEAKRGGRNYMEDVVCAMKVQNNEDELRMSQSSSVKHVKVRNLSNNNNEQSEGLSNSANELAYFAVFDGHGGPEAAEFAKDILLNEITKQKGFWTSDDAQVTRAIKDGFLSTHKLMWKAVGSWPKTASGLPSTAGTTASVVLVKNRKLYVAHVGDSSVVLGSRVDGKEDWSALTVTKEHKPDAPEEQSRIESMGGQVMRKAGIARVVWRRPRVKGPVRRSTAVDNVPFLAIARSLGDLWSYNSERDVFVVSPEPDVAVFSLDGSKHRCIILASDGIWNMIGADEAVQIVCSWVQSRKGTENESQAASILVDLALERWQNRNIRADNTSAIVVLLNPSVDYNNLVRTNCENQTAENFTYSWMLPTKSCLLPIHQNIQAAEKRLKLAMPLCGKGVLPNHISKEDRVSVRWSKLRRKVIPRFRIRWASAGSGDVRKKSKVIPRRYSVPTSNVGSTLFSSSHMMSNSGVLMTSEKFSVRTVSNIPTELGEEEEEERNICKSHRRFDVSLPSCSSPKGATSVLSPGKFNHSSETSAAVERIGVASLPVNEPLVAADATLVNLNIMGGFATPSLSLLVNPSPALDVSELPAAVLHQKRKSSEAIDLPAKRPCHSPSYSDVFQTYRNRYHTRLRIRQVCGPHAD